MQGVLHRREYGALLEGTSANGRRRGSTIIAVVNQKGGVGKTTTAVNMATYLAKHVPTLLVDLDSQANATTSIGIELGERWSITEVLVNGLAAEQAIIPTIVPGLSILPASSSLIGSELQLAATIGREFRLRKSLQALGEKYTYILIDCPPALSLLTLNALTAAHKVLVPMQCEYLALEGLSELLTTVELVQMNLNPHLELGGIVLTMFGARTALAKQIVEEVRDRFPTTFQAVIPRNARVPEAPRYGLPLMMYAPDSPGAKAYEALAEELIEVLI